MGACSMAPPPPRLSQSKSIHHRYGTTRPHCDRWRQMLVRFEDARTRVALFERVMMMIIDVCYFSIIARHVAQARGGEFLNVGGVINRSTDPSIIIICFRGRVRGRFLGSPFGPESYEVKNISPQFMARQRLSENQVLLRVNSAHHLRRSKSPLVDQRSRHLRTMTQSEYTVQLRGTPNKKKYKL